ncbi:hypothetical protein ATY75_12315 [Rhizobium sp. N122]|nr:hypothetical protein ATY75_12315 [Rhizobium sp. N122]
MGAKSCGKAKRCAVGQLQKPKTCESSPAPMGLPIFPGLYLRRWFRRSDTAQFASQMKKIPLNRKNSESSLPGSGQVPNQFQQA